MNMRFSSVVTVKYSKFFFFFFLFDDVYSFWYLMRSHFIITRNHKLIYIYIYNKVCSINHDVIIICHVFWSPSTNYWVGMATGRVRAEFFFLLYLDPVFSYSTRPVGQDSRPGPSPFIKRIFFLGLRPSPLGPAGSTGPVQPRP